MKNKKLAAALLVPFMAVSIGMAQAAQEECCSATAKVTAKLDELCELSLNGGNTVATIDSTTGNLNHALTPSFKLVSNDKHDIEVVAKLKDAAGTTDALFEKGTSVYLALANTKHLPTAAAVTNCKGAAPAVASNANVIAYKVVTANEVNGATTPLSFNAFQHKYEGDAKIGTTIVNIATDTAPESGTYSMDDAAGSYVAELTMTAFTQ